jgi:hypothetical protein
MVEGDGLLAFGDQGLVDPIEHFQEGHSWTDILGLIQDETTFVMGMFLAPHVKREVHYL